MSQRTDATSDETQEEPSQEAPHSAQSLHVTEPVPPGLPLEKKRIKWPQACKTTVWEQFDEDVDRVLEASAKGEVERKLQAMTTIIISLAQERFGEQDKKPPRSTYTMNQRAVKIHKIRQELKSLKRQHKEASEEQRPPLAELRAILRKRLMTLRRAEWHRRRRKERARKRASFIANPFGFTKQLLGQKRDGSLVCSKEEMDLHLQNTYSDPNRQEELGRCDILIDPPPPTKDFDNKEPLLREVEEVVRRARSSSAPGPSGVPYKVYKYCPLLLRRLWKILRVIWRRGKVAKQWRFAEGVWIPKEEGSRTIDQFRIISLLSVEGKVFFSIVARRLADFLSSNNYIDTSVQKGGISGVPGCLEHTGVVTQLIREARENNGDLTVLWLDLANAYGSIPHKLVETTLTKHHVPHHVADLIMDYYDQFRMRVTAGEVTSEWHKLEVGIITGCTISVTLFALAMNMIVKSAEPECRGPRTRSGIRQPPIRAFMDDLTVTTESVPGCRWILQGLEKLIRWARMAFKPAKSRSLVLRKGKVTDRFRFNIEGALIPTVSEKPVKSLGKVFDSSLKDTSAVQSTCQELDSWLRAVDRSGLPGKFKAWIYQHGILPRILWPLLVYEVPISTVETLERKVSACLRRWLGLPRSLTSIALYGNTTKLQLPIKSLEEEFKVTRTREVLMYRDSRDPKVAQAGVVVKTGRKWSAQAAVLDAESRLRHKDLVGTVAHGRAGLGVFPTPPRHKESNRKEKQRQIQEEVRAAVEEGRSSRAAGLRQQGAWTRWEQAMEHKVTWTDLWKAEPHRITFLIRAVYDVLPSPANLFTWGKVETPNCPLCSARGTLEHILSSCAKALGQGRYTWRHNQVLKPIAEAISKGISSSRQMRNATHAIPFVKAGEQPRAGHKRAAAAGILATARDWQLSVDLEKQLKFPQHIVSTTLRPDILLVSESSKNIIIMELTVPWEDRLGEAHERKRTKYDNLVTSCREQGWKARCMPIEVGCRGFVGHSLHKALSTLGITGGARSRAIKNITEAAEKASRWLWIRRGGPWGQANAT